MEKLRFWTPNIWVVTTPKKWRNHGFIWVTTPPKKWRKRVVFFLMDGSGKWHKKIPGPFHTLKDEHRRIPQIHRKDDLSMSRSRVCGMRIQSRLPNRSKKQGRNPVRQVFFGCHTQKGRVFWRNWVKLLRYLVLYCLLCEHFLVVFLRNGSRGEKIFRFCFLQGNLWTFYLVNWGWDVSPKTMPFRCVWVDAEIIPTWAKLWKDISGDRLWIYDMMIIIHPDFVGKRAGLQGVWAQPNSWWQLVGMDPNVSKVTILTV